MENSLTDKELELMNRLLAGVQLPFGRHDLSQGQPAAQGAVEDGRCETPAARPLGREPGAVFRLGTSQPDDRQSTTST